MPRGRSSEEDMVSRGRSEPELAHFENINVANLSFWSHKIFKERYWSLDIINSRRRRHDNWKPTNIQGYRVMCPFVYCLYSSSRPKEYEASSIWFNSAYLRNRGRPSYLIRYLLFREVVVVNIPEHIFNTSTRVISEIESSCEPNESVRRGQHTRVWPYRRSLVALGAFLWTNTNGHDSMKRHLSRASPIRDLEFQEQ